VKILKINIGLGKRIYLSMFALVVISSLVIAIFTAYYFKNQNETYHLERLKRKERRVANSIKFFAVKFKIAENLDEVPREFYEKIEQLSFENEMELKIYDTKGGILLTVDKELRLSDSISSTILSKIYASPDEVFINKKNETSLETYSILTNNNSEHIGILHVPNYDFSTNKIEYEDFFKTLIKLYLALLLGASILAYFLSKTITKSLRIIGEKIKEVSINKKNKKITWRSKDEIGELVKKYNFMIDQLEQSAGLLAESERESAWREMAKQVAHEIKNPLTPMKLNVQFLEHSLKPNDSDFSEKMNKFSQKMITQIDALTEIANEFSSFAKMPTTSLQKIDLKAVIENATETFKNEIKVVFNSNEITEAIIKGDENQLIRVFNNLLKNALQSISKETVGVIQVKLWQENEFYHVEIKDNGKGIEPSEYDKIFTLNFTTKSTGSGLGLAMVKSIMKNHNGTVRFESKVGKGTSFFLRFLKED